MESLKKNGFVVGVIGMLLALGACAYVIAWDMGVGKYRSLQQRVKSNQARLDAYAGMKPEELPTKALVGINADSKTRLRTAFAEAEKFFVERAKKLVRLQLSKGGEEFAAGDDAAFQSAFKTANDELDRKYNEVRTAYITRVYPEHVAKSTELTPFKLSLATELTGEERLIEEAQMCRIAAAILGAATEAKWGGLTNIAFEKKRAPKVAAEAPKVATEDEERTPKSTKSGAKSAKTGAAGGKKSAAGKSGGAAAKPAEVVVPDINPRDLYERVKVSVAGEMRWEDVGPFLHAIELRANDAEDPVFLVVDEFVMTKQKERLLPPFVQAKDAFRDPADAEKAALDHEVKLPTATLRLTLSVVKYKGFAK